MSFGHNALLWPLAAISSIYINVWSHYIVPHSELSTYWNTIPTEFCLQKKGDFKEMYFLNATYIFVQPLGCTYFIISFFQKQNSARSVFQTHGGTCNANLNGCTVSPCVQKWELIVF